MSKRKFPILVKRGDVTARIYRAPSRGCDSFTVVYFSGGRRQRPTFSDLQRAELWAETGANRMSAGELDVLTLTSADRAVFVRCQETLTPLELAVMRFAGAARVATGPSLPDDISMSFNFHKRRRYVLTHHAMRTLGVHRQGDSKSPPLRQGMVWQ